MRRKSPDEVRTLLEGPVNSIFTSFHADGRVDWQGVRNQIEIGINGGSAVSLLTFGDSQFSTLSEAEIAELTRVLVDQVRGRALTVAATGTWWTGQAVEFAKFCRDLGVDVLMHLPPMMAVDPAGLIPHYRAIAEVMPFMLVGSPPLGVLDGLLDVPNICCFKEDGTEEYGVDVCWRYGRRWKLMTGGLLWRHYTQWPYGCRAFFSWPSCFKPEIAGRYWQAVQTADKETVRHVLSDIDKPYFDRCAKFPAGNQAVQRALLEIHGVAQRFLRLPRVSIADGEMDQVRQLAKDLGLM